MSAKILQTTKFSIGSTSDAIELGFVLLIIVLFGGFYYETTKIAPEAARVPQLLISAGVVLSVLFIFFKLFQEQIYGFISNSDFLTSLTQEESTDEMTEDDLKETFENAQGSFRVSQSSIQYILVIIAYFFSLIYIGFFTTNFLFVFLYVVIENQDTLLRNIIIGALVSLANCYTLYWFVVELLGIGTVLRFGLLL
jgi:hypothetical protein